MSALLKDKLLVPSYMKSFKCIGPSCEDTCCAGWKVNIDKKTYKKYKSSSDKELKLFFDKYISRERKEVTEKTYAKINMNQYNECPFLDGHKLCKIHLKLGEEFLSDVCHGYPKKTLCIDGIYQQSAVLSCPEVARHALLCENGIEFCEIESNTRLNNLINIELAKSFSYGKFFDQLRIFCIQLMKSIDYGVWEKLIILGLFLDKAQEKVDQKNDDEIIKLIEDYTQAITRGTFKAELQNLKPQIEHQIEQLEVFIAIRNSQSISSERYIQCFNKFKDGLGYGSGSDSSVLKRRYEELIDKYYEPFMEKHEFILENYIVNYMFSNFFPFRFGKGLFDNYLMLIIHYLYIKMLLVGMSGYYKESFNTECIIELIQSFSKTIDHNPDYINKVIEIMNESGAAKLSYIVLLIKDK